MPARALLITTVALLAAAPAAAGAATTLPVREADGVRIVRQRGGGEAIVFTRRANRLWKEIAGKEVEISCTQLGVGLFDEGGEGFSRRAPKRRAPLPLGGIGRNDLCSVELRYEHGEDLSYDTVVAIPLTQAGATLLDEREKAGAMMLVLAFGGIARQDSSTATFATPERVIATVRTELPRGERVAVVALAAETDTPPAGKVGYWSGDPSRAAVVTLSATGRRLYVALGPGDELRTNIARLLFSGE